MTIDEAIDAMGLGRHHRIGLGDGVSIVGAELRRGQESATPPAPFVAALSEADELGVPLDELRGVLPFEVADPLARTLIERGWLRSV